jgi:4-hydroxy-tetrahydrodipicolinate synthase
MPEKKFIGTGVAIVTPFRKDCSIDFKSLQKLVNHLISNGVEYLVVLGTTGETPTLTNDEKNAIVSFVVETADKRVPIVVGIGGNYTDAIVEKIKDTDFNGIDAILSVGPYYNKPSQTGYYEHFKAIANVSPVPLILYNVPGRTGSNISAETVLQLSKEFKNHIIGVKEASGNFSQIMNILKYKHDRFRVFSGDDALAYPLITLGASGVISVIANAFPAEFSTMIRHTLQGKLDEAKKIHYSLLPVIDSIFAEGSPAGVKAVLEILGISSNFLRLPIVPISKDLYKKLEKQVGELKKIGY